MMMSPGPTSVLFVTAEIVTSESALTVTPSVYARQKTAAKKNANKDAAAFLINAPVFLSKRVLIPADTRKPPAWCCIQE